MSEPTNPLFEEEKAFLERKKLEYERALRGDVAQLKDQTVQVGRVALVGTGLVGSLWLITKAFSGGKRRKKQRTDAEWPTDADYDSADYNSQRFADFDFADDDDDSRHPNDYWREADPYFGSSAYEPSATHGTVYHSETDDYDTPSEAGERGDADADDNGLGDYPDFPEHSAPHHGADAAADAEDFQSEAYGHPESSLPFDDSRRLPESNGFMAETGAKAAKPKRHLGPMLVALAKSDVGKILLGQAASVAAALVTKSLKDKLSSGEAETAKSSDLAGSTGSTDGYAHGHPATPQPDANPAPADAPTYREPLA